MEYLIRTKDGEEIDFPDSSGPEIFLPYNLEATVSPDYKVSYEGAVFSFSFEMPGIQVSLASGEIQEQKADIFVAAVAKTIELASRQSCEYLRVA